MKASIPLERWEEIGFIEEMDTPDSSAEEPMKEKPAEFRWWQVLLVTALIVVPIGLLSRPLARGCGKNARQMEVVNNAREVYKALWDFNAKYGRLPGPETIEEVRKSTGTSISLGTSSSNDYLRQLIASGADERIFYSGSKKFRCPDGNVDGKRALEKGECGFAYVTGTGMSDHLSTPVLIGPVMPGERRFDTETFNRKIMILRLEGSATFTTVNIHGHISLGGGKSIDPAKPEWNGKPLNIVWPE